MAIPQGLTCIRCGDDAALDAFDRACRRCAADGFASNLTVRYAEAPSPARHDIPSAPRSMWRHAGQLPIAADQSVSLGEGATPLFPVDGLVPCRLLVKDETRNPTWSFKDRLASVAVSWAKHTGAKVIATSSSGNAGAAAAYAARAGLPCVVLTFDGVAAPMIAQIRSYGAMVLTLATKDDRWAVLSEAVRELGWFPTSPFFGPAVGSNPIGLEGYKTLAYEIAEGLDWRAPEWCVLPVCYGDAIYGMWKGFEEMRRWGWIEACPRLIAAEVSGSLSAALAGDDAMPPDVPRTGASLALSIDVTRGTYQALHAVRRSGGVAVTLDDEALLDWQRRLASGAGLFVETSSAAALAAIDRLTESGTIGRDDTVVAVLTASGLKDSGTGATDAPEVAADLDSVLGALRQAYGFDG
jgi:threonine synthase